MQFPDLDFFKFWKREDDNTFKQEIANNIESVAPPTKDDGALEIEVSSYGGVQQSLLSSQDIQAQSTKDLVNQYRALMVNYEVDNAVQEIVNDAIVYEDHHDVVRLTLDDTDFSDSVQTRIQEEFDNVLSALAFQRKGADHFKRWYVDSRLFFHKIIDPNKPKEGILEMRRLDPRRVQFVRELHVSEEQGVKVVKGYLDYFLYQTGNDSYNAGGMYYGPGSIVKIPASAVTYAHSGLIDGCGDNIVGYLHRAVKPANQLKLMEDALVIYRITRAPDRRIFYIDTGNMPSRKATQFMQSIMNSMKNRVTYDVSTGRVKNRQNNMALTEDIWLQRREGKNITEVDTLPSLSGMSDMDDVRYFRKAFYMALRVPLSRIPDEQNGGVLVDNGSQVTRDELGFSKFIRTLQHNFSPTLLDPLRSNLLLKSIITEDDWERNINNIKLNFHRDSYFTEMKDLEIAERRAAIVDQLTPIVGKYYSNETVMKTYLHMSDEDIKREHELITAENKNPIYKEEDEEP